MSRTAPAASSPWAKVGLFLALSRTPHGLLDLATPCLGAALCLGGPPSGRVLALGLITAFAGYTAVYALNDLVDLRRDREKLTSGGSAGGDGYLDAALVRHPLAQGVLGLGEGLIWTIGWGLIALAGAYALNPVCAGVFLAGCALEAVYCLLLKVSHWRALLAGVVKTLGGLAAILAVDPRPSPVFLAAFLAWIFCWEIGGQNAPADWHDLEADRTLSVRTLPVRYGPRLTSRLVLACLGLGVALSALVLRLPSAPVAWPLVGLTLATGVYFLLWPALKLLRRPGPERAGALFNQASSYPLAVLVVVVAGWLG